MNTTQNTLDQLQKLIDEYKEMRETFNKEEFKTNKESISMRFITRARAAIHRISGAKSQYMEQCDDILKRKISNSYMSSLLFGVVESLHADIKDGYLDTLQELIHADIFGDFLEMAEYLSNEGFKDAAAVIAGSSLEAHLRQLCNKAGIDTEYTSQNGVKPKKADQLNSELSKMDIYPKLDQKSITSWLGLRNHAAHGQYENYEMAQVQLMIAGIRDFISRTPA